MKIFRLLPILIIMVVFYGCGMRHYTPEDLARLDAKHTEGTVIKQSRGSFILKDGAGEEQIFRTGELTEYMPADYRSLEGDTVKVTYKDENRAVLQLAPIMIPDKNKPLQNPIKGEIVSTGRGSSRHSHSLWLKVAGVPETVQIYLPVNNLVMEIDGAQDSAISQSLIGAHAEISARRVPIFRGNAYLYEAEKVYITSQR